MTERIAFECPLCHSVLSQARYLQVVGVWQEQQRFKASLKAKLAEAKKAKQEAKNFKAKLILQYQRESANIKKKVAADADKRIATLTKKMDARLRSYEQREERAAADRLKLFGTIERLRKDVTAAERRGERKAKQNADLLVKQLEKKIFLSEAASRKAEKDNARLQRTFRTEIRKVERAAIEKGRVEIKKANEKVLKTVKTKDTQIERLNTQVKELHEQIRKGVTQQVEGLNFERVLAEELAKRFRDDAIESFGKGGDILHTVKVKGKTIGAILFECKKTDKWSNDFLKQAIVSNVVK